MNHHIPTLSSAQSSSRRLWRGVTTTAATLALVAGTVDAQVFDVGGGTNSRGFHQPNARRNMVAHGNHLYAVVVEESGAVRIRRKVNDVTSPWTTIGPVVNDAATGISTSNPTTSVAMACTTTRHLHITWGRYYYPSFFKQYYRCYQLSGIFTHAPQDITALAGASVTTRTDSMAIAVGPNDEVYLTAPNGTQAWRNRLLQSQWTGYPTGPVPTWDNRGSVAGNAASSQNTRIVVDTTGKVQTSFYNNIGNGQYATRVFSPPSTWSAQEQIGVPPSPRDDCGYLASDYTRYTHVLYKHLVSTVGPLITYELRYRKRFGTTPWSAPITVETFTNVEHGSDNPKHSYALAATTKGDRVFAIYRDYRCKRLMVKQLKYGASAFQHLAELRSASTLPNDFYMPNVRNTLFSNTNSMVNFLDITYRQPSGSTYRLVHQRLEIGAMDVDLTGCSGTCGVPAITYGGVPCSPMPHTVKFGLERARPGAPAWLLWTLSGGISVPFAGCQLYANNILSMQTVDPCCHAELSVPLPAGCYGFDLYNQWAVLDSGASFGWALSNRGTIRL